MLQSQLLIVQHAYCRRVEMQLRPWLMQRTAVYNVQWSDRGRCWYWRRSASRLRWQCRNDNTLGSTVNKTNQCPVATGCRITVGGSSSSSRAARAPSGSRSYPGGLAPLACTGAESASMTWAGDGRREGRAATDISISISSPSAECASLVQTPRRVSSGLYFYYYRAQSNNDAYRNNYWLAGSTSPVMSLGTQIYGYSSDVSTTGLFIELSEFSCSAVFLLVFIHEFLAWLPSLRLNWLSAVTSS